MADIYVDASAEAGGDGSESTPYNTIDAAIVASADDDTIYAKGTFTAKVILDGDFDGKTGVTLTKWGDDACIINVAGEILEVTVANTTASSITFTGVTFSQSSDASYLFDVNGNCSLTFQECTISAHPASLVVADMDTDYSTRGITFLDCVVSAGTSGLAGGVQWRNNSDGITIKGGSWSLGASLITGIGGNLTTGVYVKDLVVTSTDAAEVSDYLFAYNGLGSGIVDVGTIWFENVTATNWGGGLSVLHGANKVIVRGCDIRASVADSTSPMVLVGTDSIGGWDTGKNCTLGTKVLHNNNRCYMCISAINPSGSDSDEPGIGANWATYWADVTTGPTVIENNYLEYATEADAHGIFIAAGPVGGLVSNNFIKNANYQIVIKCPAVVVENNIAVGPNGLYVLGGANCVIKNNTIYATNSFAFAWDKYDETGTLTVQKLIYPNVLVVINNIFTNADTGIADYAYRECPESSDTEHYNIIMDYNCYWSAGANIAFLNGSVRAKATGLSVLTAVWIAGHGTNGNYNEDNDAHSTIQNPSFANPAAGDFRVMNYRKLWSGKPDTTTDRATYIGAIGPDASGPIGRDYRSGGNRWRY